MIFRKKHWFTIGWSNCLSLVGCGVCRFVDCIGDVLRVSGEVRLELLLQRLLALGKVACCWRFIPTGADVWIR